jgi:hypothetical protein
LMLTWKMIAVAVAVVVAVSLQMPQHMISTVQ